MCCGADGVSLGAALCHFFPAFMRARHEELFESDEVAKAMREYPDKKPLSNTQLFLAIHWTQEWTAGKGGLGNAKPATDNKGIAHREKGASAMLQLPALAR